MSVKLLQLEHWNQEAAYQQPRPRRQLVLPVPAGQVELGVLLVRGELMPAGLRMDVRASCACM
jgi:hypothetical protein